MEQNIVDAVCILKLAYDNCRHEWTYVGGMLRSNKSLLRNAITHLVRPERDIYPKVRHAKKTMRGRGTR